MRIMRRSPPPPPGVALDVVAGGGVERMEGVPHHFLRDTSICRIKLPIWHKNAHPAGTPDACARSIYRYQSLTSGINGARTISMHTHGISMLTLIRNGRYAGPSGHSKMLPSWPKNRG